jgi:hypothetical protein
MAVLPTQVHQKKFLKKLSFRETWKYSLKKLSESFGIRRFVYPKEDHPDFSIFQTISPVDYSPAFIFSQNNKPKIFF